MNATSNERNGYLLPLDVISTSLFSNDHAHVASFFQNVS
jgi:hypothetical protein